MSLLIVLLVVALLFGLGGILTAAKWLLIFALLFLILGLIDLRR